MNRLVLADVLYNRRQCKLDRRSGRRRHRPKEEAEHKVRHDESLRIVSDADFEAVQARLASRGSSFRGGRSPRSHKQMRAFTGLLYCAQCGSVYYAERSHNKKGDYHYYRCGRRKRKGPDACGNVGSVREDVLVGRVRKVMSDVLADDSIVEAAVSEAEKALDNNRDTATRLQRQIDGVDVKVRLLTEVVADPETDRSAVPALTRQIGALEDERSKALTALDGLRKNSETNLDRLTRVMRQALNEMRESLEVVSTEQAFHDMVEEILGPIEVHEDGSLSEKKAASEEETSEACRTHVVAGACYVLRMVRTGTTM